MGLVGLIMACYGGLWGILTGLTKSTDHPSTMNMGLVLSQERQDWQSCFCYASSCCPSRVSHVVAPVILVWVCIVPLPPNLGCHHSVRGQKEDLGVAVAVRTKTSAYLHPIQPPDSCDSCGGSLSKVFLPFESPNVRSHFPAANEERQYFKP